MQRFCFLMTGALAAALTLSACSDDDSANRDLGIRTDLRVALTVSDSQIAQAVFSIDTGEINAAQAAKAKLTRSDLRSFADQMITDHTNANAKLQTVMTSQNIMKQASMLSQTLEADANALVQELGTSNNVDTLYLSSQVDMHRMALALIECVFVPQVDNASLSMLLSGDLQLHVAMHLAEALSLLGASNALADGGTGNDCARLCVAKSAGGPLSDDVRGLLCP